MTSDDCCGNDTWRCRCYHHEGVEDGKAEPMSGDYYEGYQDGIAEATSWRVRAERAEQDAERLAEYLQRIANNAVAAPARFERQARRMFDYIYDIASTALVAHDKETTDE